MRVLKWTQEEDERLLSLISENRSNLQEAFRRFHEEFPNRTVKAITFRWYGVLRLRNTTNVCMVTAKKEACPDGFLKDTPPVKVSIWKRLINFFKNM